MGTEPGDALWQAAALLPDAVLTAPRVPPAQASALARTLRGRHGIPTVAAAYGTSRPDHVVACLRPPCTVDQLLPLLRAVSPDPAADSRVALETGALHLDPTTCRVRLCGQPVHLPPREFALLHLLMLHAGRVVTPAQLRQLPWAAAPDVLDGYVACLRARLGDSDPPRIVVWVTPLGYRLEAPPR